MKHFPAWQPVEKQAQRFFNTLMGERMLQSNPAHWNASETQVEKVVFVRDNLGLHARPAARLAQAAQAFEARITLSHEDMTVDAKSILDILSLAAGQGASLVLRCEGGDALVAAQSLADFFNED